MTFIVGVALLIVAGAIVGVYAAWLFASVAASPAPHAEPSRLPFVLIVVPVFDEALLIEEKLANLAALTYPAARRRVVIVDGGSADGTVALTSRWIAARPDFALLRTSHRNKTAQLSEALQIHPEGEWILVTDADALLAPDTLQRLTEVARDERIGVVGAHVRPASAHALESLHWRATDWMRGREANRGSAAIVAAPCYLVRRELLAGMPSDTVADDVHVACRAMLAGLRVGVCDSTVLELRSPRELTTLLRHKFRKADAYLREIVRFLPAAHRIPPPMRAIFFWRAVLLMIVPLLSAAAFCLMAFSAPTAVAVSTTILVVTRPRVVALFAVLAAVLAAALLRYPFSRQVASFPKIAQ